MFGISKNATNGDSEGAHDVSLLFDDQRGISLGEGIRYKINVDMSKVDKNLQFKELSVLLKNMESPLLRPVYLTGPYSLYVDIRPHNYSELKEFKGDDLQFIADMKPDETFTAVLKLTDDARVGDAQVYSWTIDVLSQMTVATAHLVRYRICLGLTEQCIKQAIKLPSKEIYHEQGIEVQVEDTDTIWNAPPPFPDLPIHVLFITHGVFSNVGCDMLYINDRIREATAPLPRGTNPNIVIRGYNGNAGKTHKGIGYLGNRLAEYIMSTIEELKKEYKVEKVSFIGHSLGGPVQAAALHLVSLRQPYLFDPAKGGAEPVNFIALASPFLGVIGDSPLYATLVLGMGALGKTGRDLNLKRSSILPDFIHESASQKPILEWIPTGSGLRLFERFKSRTLYANALHDGIVPLRTAALLYLDWYGMQGVQSIEDQGSPNVSDAQSAVPTYHSKEAMVVPDDKTSSSWLTFNWPLSKIMHKRKIKWYKRSQTIRLGSEISWDDENDDFRPPSKASALMSAANLLTSPLPSQGYLKNPRLRTDYIFHDKVYFPDELPPPHYQKRELVKKIVYPHNKIHRFQERIARNWQETMSWRKVVVNLQPESHNNMVVRRRFVNMFGWVVIEHMIEEHFLPAT